ncbi:hypothetical protein KOR34_18380 [Posidoniimonas corsicana]|uniref:Lipocalin-like domain-containing protein n=1 Tax=Posidoniimonas corsicana TaxID=1938618 RepID=A0A5C5VFP0_9BACT|nr:hypothetical protein [Posidoniimonas corsicana]TWT36893.1 hypothetical protein KOR34_18380 [Posidoniimonas corsicana]
MTPAVLALLAFAIPYSDFVDSVPTPEAGRAVAVAPNYSGQWRLDWDDVVDGSLAAEPKSCTVRLKCVAGELSGDFIGPVAGRERDAVIRGEVSHSVEGSLLTFKQVEEGYACCYLVFLSATTADASAQTGVWHDTRGGAGEFRLLKHQ